MKSRAVQRENWRGPQSKPHGPGRLAAALAAQAAALTQPNQLLALLAHRGAGAEAALFDILGRKAVCNNLQRLAAQPPPRPLLCVLDLRRKEPGVELVVWVGG